MNIFITGGTSGIGLQLCRLYLAEGHKVGVCGFETPDFQKLRADAKNAVEFFNVDVTNREELIKTIRNFAGSKLDLLIASAGINNGVDTKDLPNFSRERKIFEVNVLGTLSAFEAAVPAMAERRSGHLVAIASASGLTGFAGNGGYSASKAAVINLCESYAMDFARYGIQVSAICPGFVDTPLTKTNSKKMPFLMSAENAALKIKKAIDHKKALYIFPLPAFLIMRTLYHLPRGLYRFLLRPR